MLSICVRNFKSLGAKEEELLKIAILAPNIFKFYIVRIFNIVLITCHQDLNKTLAQSAILTLKRLGIRR